MDEDRELLKTSRRSFCRALVLGGASVVLLNAGCKPRLKVFKYPESAEEIADLNEFFVAPNTTEAEIVRVLRLSGEPKLSEVINGYSHKTFPQQNEMIKKVEFDYYKDNINGLLLEYAKPVSVSMGRLSGLLGEPADQGITVGRIDQTPDMRSAFQSNRPIRQGPGPQPPQSTFRYRPKVSHPGGKGFASEVTVDTDGRDANVKGVESIRFYRYAADLYER